MSEAPIEDPPTQLLLPHLVYHEVALDLPHLAVKARRQRCPMIHHFPNGGIGQDGAAGGAPAAGHYKQKNLYAEGHACI